VIAQKPIASEKKVVVDVEPFQKWKEILSPDEYIKSKAESTKLNKYLGDNGKWDIIPRFACPKFWVSKNL